MDIVTREQWMDGLTELINGITKSKEAPEKEGINNGLYRALIRQDGERKAHAVACRIPDYKEDFEYLYNR